MLLNFEKAFRHPVPSFISHALVGWKNRLYCYLIYTVLM